MQRRPTKRYWKALNSLYGEQTEFEGVTAAPKKKTAPRASNCATEAQEQFAAVAWLRKMNILFYHVPNGGYRDYREGAKFKRLGVSAGVPDICLPLPRKGYHGLYIELKRVSGGKLSDSQEWWLAELRKQGYDVYVAQGAQDLISYVKKYLEMTNDQGS